jgi:hypothetical protein
MVSLDILQDQITEGHMLRLMTNTSVSSFVRQQLHASYRETDRPGVVA